MEKEKGYFLTGILLSLISITKAQAADLTKCTTSVSGREYRGFVNVTASGKPCESWSKLPLFKGQAQLFPDCSVEDAGNFCRNPYDTSDLSKFPNNIRPACFFIQPDGGRDWSFCNIAHCDLPTPPTTCYSAKLTTPSGDTKLCSCRIKVRTNQPVIMLIMEIIFEYKIAKTGVCNRQVDVTMDLVKKSYVCDGSTYTRTVHLMILYWVEKLEFQKTEPGDSEYAIKVSVDGSISVESCGNKDWKLGTNWDVKFTTVPTAAPPSKAMCTTTPGSTTMVTTLKKTTAGETSTTSGIRTTTLATTVVSTPTSTMKQTTTQKSSTTEVLPTTKTLSTVKSTTKVLPKTTTTELPTTTTAVKGITPKAATSTTTDRSTSLTLPSTESSTQSHSLSSQSSTTSQSSSSAPSASTRTLAPSKTSAPSSTLTNSSTTLAGSPITTTTPTSKSSPFLQWTRKPSAAAAVGESLREEVIIAATLGATLGILLIAIFIVISCLSCRRCRWRWKQTAEFPLDDLDNLPSTNQNFTYGSPNLESQEEISNGDSQYEWPQSNGVLSTSTFKANGTDSTLLSNGSIYRTSRPEETTLTNYGYYNPADNELRGGHPVPDYDEVNMNSINPRIIPDGRKNEIDSEVHYTTVVKGNMKQKESPENNNGKSVTFSKFSTFKTFR